jgi:chromosome segregation ATPase
LNDQRQASGKFQIENEKKLQEHVEIFSKIQVNLNAKDDHIAALKTTLTAHDETIKQLRSYVFSLNEVVSKHESSIKSADDSISSIDSRLSSVSSSGQEIHKNIEIATVLATKAISRAEAIWKELDVFKQDTAISLRMKDMSIDKAVSRLESKIQEMKQDSEPSSKDGSSSYLDTIRQEFQSKLDAFHIDVTNANIRSTNNETIVKAAEKKFENIYLLIKRIELSKQ